MSKIDDFLSLIQDGTWHSLTQLSKKLSLPKQQLAKISEILSEKEIIHYQEKANWVKINPEWSPLLTENKEEKPEHKPTTGTIIIPPQESLTIQKVQITNVTEKEVEIWIRVCRESTEIGISKVT